MNDLTTSNEAGATFPPLEEDLADRDVQDESRANWPIQVELFEIQKPGPTDFLSVKDDISSMEYPIFSLSKHGDNKIREYKRGGYYVKIIPSGAGAATVFDKDLLIYCLSHLVKANDSQRATSRRVKVPVGPFLQATQRSSGGASYERVIDMCRRLKGTIIETNVRTEDKKGVRGFGLIEDYAVDQYTKNGKGALVLEVTLSEWFYKAAMQYEILTIDPTYYCLGKSLERRVYELARKHTGDKAWFEIGLQLLREKAGSTQELRRFKTEIKDIVANDGLPEYRIFLDETVKPGKLVVLTRDSKKLMSEAQKQGRVEWLQQLLQSNVPAPGLGAPKKARKAPKKAS